MAEDLKTFRQFSSTSTPIAIALPSGKKAVIESFVLQLPDASPARLPNGSLSSTYTSKPLVDLEGEALFGELAIVRLLKKDGWTAVWADTFHGGKFWANMPNKSSPVRLPPQVQKIYDRIAAAKGGPSGCFDVIAWNGDRVVFLEYKSLRDKSNKNELLWISAAVDAGISERDLYFVGQRSR